jgi:hypothetical protein
MAKPSEFSRSHYFEHTRWHETVRRKDKSVDDVRPVIFQAQENEESVAIRLRRNQPGRATLIQFGFSVRTPCLASQDRPFRGIFLEVCAASYDHTEESEASLGLQNQPGMRSGSLR